MDIKVIFRKVRWTAPSGKTFTDVEAFFPELSASYGKICGYCRSEGWFESNLDYYWVSKPAAEHEYKGVKAARRKEVENSIDKHHLYGYISKLVSECFNVI